MMMARILLPYVHAFRDRHGKLRHYFRKRGCKRIPLPGLPGSIEFNAAYQNAVAGIEVQRQEIGAKRTKSGSVSAALVGYYGSPQFLSLRQSTQAQRRRILERFRDKTGDWSIATLPQSYVVSELQKRKPGAQRNLLKALRSLIAFAGAVKMMSGDPTAGIKLAKHKERSRRAWTDAEVRGFESAHPIGTKPRLAFALGFYTGQRVGDVIGMGRQHVRSGVLHVKQSKTGVDLHLPVTPELQIILDATPTANLTFLVTRSGRPYSQTDFSKQFRVWCDTADLPPDVSFHGLRATRATHLAEAGATAHEIMAVTGHQTLKEVERYTRAAEQKRLAAQAMAKTRTPGGKPFDQVG
jgi:integrase